MVRSQVIGKIGVALPPLHDGVMAAAKAGRGDVGYYDAAAFGLPKASVRKEAAFLWLQYIGRPEVQTSWTIDSLRVVHQATLDDPAVKARDEATGGYFSLLARYGELFGGAPPFAFHEDARKILAPYIALAVRGRLTPSDALDRAAEKMDQLLDRLKEKGALRLITEETLTDPSH